LENQIRENIYMNIDELQTHPNNDKLLPMLAEMDLQRLKERIKTYGFTEELEINKNKVILDGHNRVNILKKYRDELKIEQVPCRIVDIPEEEENAYIISKNFDRRQLSLLMQSYLRGKYYNEVKKKLGSNQYTEKLTVGDPEKYLKSSELVADRYGTSSSTIEKDGRFVNKCNDLILQTSHDFVFNLLNGKIDANKNLILKLAELPEEAVYNVHKYYKNCDMPYPSLLKVISKFTQQVKVEDEEQYFSVRIKRDYIPRIMELNKETNYTPKEFMDVVMKFYFDNHQK